MNAMTKSTTARPSDATLQQSIGFKRLSWSGFRKSDINGQRASIQACVNNNQRARASKKSRSGNLSRRIEWRNSLWPQRFWCPLSRQPVQKKPQMLVIISSRSRPRFMLSQARLKANTTDLGSRQGVNSASFQACFAAKLFHKIPDDLPVYAQELTSLWSMGDVSVSLIVPRSTSACAQAWVASRPQAALSAVSDNRSFQCQSARSFSSSVQHWRWQPALVRPRSRTIHQCRNLSSWSQPAPKAKVGSILGQTCWFGPAMPQFALSAQKGQLC